jgi:hypothetical protein
VRDWTSAARADGADDPALRTAVSALLDDDARALLAEGPRSSRDPSDPSYAADVAISETRLARGTF